MDQTCVKCRKNFGISELDLAFYKKVSPRFDGQRFDIPIPTLCPDCRMQRRLVFRNESSMYHRKCSKLAKQIISIYRPDVTFPVYCPEEWFGDRWDAKDYGRDFDFSRPFFEQFAELRDKVPHLSLISSNNENCDFCNIVGNSKNCYLCYGSIECESCYYGNPFRCKSCVDSLLLRNSELCLECLDSEALYDCLHCQNCSNSSALKFCFGLTNCRDCFACVNLNQKQFCILNKQYSEEEYFKTIAEINLCDRKQLSSIFDQLNHLKQELPQRFYVGLNNESVSGNYIWNSKNSLNAYNIQNCEDVKNVYQLLDSHDCMDVDHGEYGTRCYEIEAYYDRIDNCQFCYFIWAGASNLLYCAHCTQGVDDCFGCVGLKRSQYCILNKQYSKEDYDKLVAKIIAHMKKTGEWGEFFPASLSPFAYNESLANEYYPLLREEAERSAYGWYVDDSEKMYKGPKTLSSDDVQKLSQDVCNSILICEVTGKPYKILPQELKMYQHFNISLPKRCPKQRHFDRLQKRNPMHLWARNCDKCGRELQSTYAPDRPERVCCEECYLKEVY